MLGVLAKEAAPGTEDKAGIGAGAEPRDCPHHSLCLLSLPLRGLATWSLRFLAVVPFCNSGTQATADDQVFHEAALSWMLHRKLSNGALGSKDFCAFSWRQGLESTFGLGS